MYNFEGDRGLDKLNKLCKALGYKENGFQYGSSLEVFLADNPGAVEAIIDWLGDQNLQSWCDKLEEDLESDEDEDEYS